MSAKKKLKKTPDIADTEDHMASGKKTGRGYLSAPGIVDLLVDYTVVDGLAIHDGCIELGPVKEVEQEAARIRAKLQDQKTVDAAGDDASDDPAQRGIGHGTDSAFLWTNGIVYYTIAADVPNQGRVADAITHIEENTAISFVQRTNQANYCEIISNGNNSWSSSAVGMRGGKQLIRYADGHSWQILVHEFLHMLGVYHEQSRSDRDDFVEIKWDNIQDDAVGNFQKKPGTTDYYDYDYGSIMHYRSTSFAKDPSKPTIVPKQPGAVIGQRQSMSFGDRQTIAKMYQRFEKRGYAGVWRAGSGRYALWVNADWDSFRQKWQLWSSQGLRLHDIHVRHAGGRNRYSGVFLPGSGRYGLWASVPWASFRSKWQQWSSEGLRLVDIHVHRVGNENRYSGVFLPGSGSHGLWANTSWASFRSKWQQWSGQGLRLVDIHVHRVGNQTRYTGVFLPGSGRHGLWANVPWSSFVAKWRELSGQGLRLVDLNMHRAGGNLRYSGAFLPGNDRHYLWANVTYEGFRAKWQELAGQGLRLIDFEIALPSHGVADVADQSLAGAELGAEDEEQIEPFGGLFEGDSPMVARLGDEMMMPEEDHGGLGGGDAAYARGQEDIEDQGGAFFYTMEDKTADTEMAGADGGLLISEDAAAAVPMDGNGHGGADLEGFS